MTYYSNGRRIVGDDITLFLQMKGLSGDGSRYTSALGYGEMKDPVTGDFQNYLDSADQLALKGYFEHQRDEALGNYRPEAGAEVVARLVGDEIHVFHEGKFLLYQFDAQTLRTLDSHPLSPEKREARRAATELKSTLRGEWRGAASGEVWEVTYSGNAHEEGEGTEKALVLSDSAGRCFFRFSDATAMSVDSNRILSAERLLP